MREKYNFDELEEENEQLESRIQELEKRNDVLEVSGPILLIEQASYYLGGS